jgi:hypothetical protein
MRRAYAAVLRLTFAVLLAPAAAPAQEVPCSVLRSAAHGVLVLGARDRGVGGPGCAIMNEYRDWLARTDDLLTAGPASRFTGREWDFASGAMRIGVPREFVLLRGDSLSPPRRDGTRRLHLTALVSDAVTPAVEVGSWHVLVDVDSASVRLFRSAVTERGLRVALRARSGTVWATRGVAVDGRRVRAQLAAARALRASLGFDDPLPPAHFIVGPAHDTTLAVLGITSRRRPLFAMMVHPPLAVFAPVGADGGLDAHELVHVATMGRREAVPPSVGEAYALHAAGSHGRPFAEAVCASRILGALPPLGAAQVDSALRGRWWDDDRADVAGFAMGHAIGWFIAARGDSAWIFADGPRAPDGDLLTFLGARAGIAREAALAAVTDGLAARRAACAGATPPTATPAGRARSRR